MSNDHNGAADIIKAAREGQEAKILTVEHGGVIVPFLFRPLGGGSFAVESIKGHIDQYRDKPERRAGTAVLCDLNSFTAHAKRFADVDSAIFFDDGGDEGNPKFTSVLDYHRAGATSDPRFGKHRGSYKLETSPEWDAWTQISGAARGQQEFADFLDERAADIFDAADAHPETLHEIVKWYSDLFGARVAKLGGSLYATRQALMDVAESLTVTVTDRVCDAVRTNVGATRLSFDSSTTTSLDIPVAFCIAVPVFKGGDLYQVPVRLKLALKQNGDMKRTEWKIELYGDDRVYEACLLDMRADVAAKTGLPILAGSPE